jgi:type IV fimbrial biogenesis protein FimT
MRRQRGFNLIEMLVVLIIIGILLGLGLPSYRTYMANQRVLSTAEVFMAGLQMARGEAVKRNLRVEFALTDVDPVVANVDTASTSATGRNWIVRALIQSPPPPAVAVTANTFIEGKSGAEGSGKASSTDSTIAVSGSVASITFDGFGMPVGLTTTATFDFANTTGSCAAPATANCTVAGTGGGEFRCPQLRINRGGQARMCDPAVLISDTRNCCL